MSDALFSRTQQRVLLLFGQPDRTFGTVELIELAKSGRGAADLRGALRHRPEDRRCSADDPDRSRAAANAHPVRDLVRLGREGN